MKSQNLKISDKLSGFVVDRIETIPELSTEAVLFTHEKTGAKLLHLFNEDPNNLFCIAFRTPVYNNTGVPHILEHSVLAGSKKFPLKDPFKEMLKGSLQTFLNAITYPDKTMYPVSSQVEKDYYNLVDVYCDAVFNPLLNENTFYQEGWHYELEDEKADVALKGIVYNEMKGVFSDFRSHVGRKTLSALYPDTTYFFESGGEPEHIPELSYDEFKEFHRKFYHPSNSFTVLYGNLESEKSLKFLNDKYLESFSELKIDSEINAQEIWDKPRENVFSAPAAKEDDGTCTVVASWITGNSSDPVKALLGKIFSHYFFTNDSSFMRKALVDSELGEDLDDMCGFDGDLIQGMFNVGLRKVKIENSEKVKDLIKETLQKELDKGLDDELIEGAIRQIEFNLREITGGGHFPYNLMLAERAYRSWIYGGDPLAHLAFEKPLNFIKDNKAKGPEFFNNMFKEFFIENKHALYSVVKASSELGEKLGSLSREQAANLSKDFNEDDKKEILKKTAELLEEQKKEPTAEALASLPKLSREDLPLKDEIVPTEMHNLNGTDLYLHPIFSAGIVYLDLGFELLTVEKDLIPYIPLYSELMTRCGAGDKSSEDMARWVTLSTGGITCSDVCCTKYGTSDELVFKLFFHGKALSERFSEMLQIFKEMLLEPKLNDPKLVKDIIIEMKNDLHSYITRSGHTYAIREGSSRISKSKSVEEMTDGIFQLRFLDKILKEDKIGNIISVLETLHKKIISKKNLFLSMTGEKANDFLDKVTELAESLPKNDNNIQDFNFEPETNSNDKGYLISSSVNYVSKSWKVDALTPEASGVYYLLSRNLSTGYLWDKVRVEGGAYGGMSITGSLHPIFSCASYRDPNLSSTLKHFEMGLKHIIDGIPEDDVEQSVIGTIGKLDSPRGPHSKGFQETLSRITGRSVESRQEMREAILNCNSETLSKYAKSIVESLYSSTTIIGNDASFKEASANGDDLRIENLV